MGTAVKGNCCEDLGLPCRSGYGCRKWDKMSVTSHVKKFRSWIWPKAGFFCSSVIMSSFFSL